MGMPVPMAHEAGTQAEVDPFARAVDEARQEEGEGQGQGQVGGNEEADERRTRRRSWWRPSLRGRRGAGGGASASAEGSGSASVSEGERVEDAYGAVDDTHAEEDGASLEPTVGRTEAEATPVPTEVPGVGMGGIDASRTFLIYVIGGYYPPEHGILNGAGGAESLEALFRELPELLGYARPPTASKADIARAGLTVLRPAELPEAEKAGRVVSNCVERCLICLDDYDPADDIRVLSCRHAFHLTCVDRWLETGRNNCPACRTKGVPTDPMAHAAAAHA
ncbi:hypothetical protein B0H14DRAFT_2778677 [Mycena olivaceomarginata]|nr:hypothetical protein B0H14DRAFT_2778677 [Mycena olivaceomarginata]